MIFGLVSLKARLIAKLSKPSLQVFGCPIFFFTGLQVVFNCPLEGLFDLPGIFAFIADQIPDEFNLPIKDFIGLTEGNRPKIKFRLPVPNGASLSDFSTISIPVRDLLHFTSWAGHQLIISVALFHF